MYIYEQHVCLVPAEPRGGPLELVSQIVVSCHVVLGIELRSPRRVASALIHWTITAPQLYFYSCSHCFKHINHFQNIASVSGFNLEVILSLKEYLAMSDYPVSSGTGCGRTSYSGRVQLPPARDHPAPNITGTSVDALGLFGHIHV